MVEYMKNFFDFEISALYFSYIFDFNKINEKKIKNMYLNYDKENIRYIFYNAEISCFYDMNLNNKQKTEVSKFKLTKEQKSKKKILKTFLEQFINKLLK